MSLTCKNCVFYEFYANPTDKCPHEIGICYHGSSPGTVWSDRYGCSSFSDEEVEIEKEVDIQDRDSYYIQGIIEDAYSRAIRENGGWNPESTHRLWELDSDDEGNFYASLTDWWGRDYKQVKKILIAFKKGNKLIIV